MKSLLLIGITALNLTVLAPSAEARMAIESPSIKGIAGGATQARKTGVIGKIDLSDGSIEVGGVKYLFSPSLTRVSRKNGETVNPLSLNAKTHIEFSTKKEGAKERITDILLIGEK